jgi:DNA-directed RNA polymerase specialized sigma24 family protein
MALQTTYTTDPPLGLDPENHLLQREALDRVLHALRRHRFGHAFLTRALDERPWQELADDLGVEPNTLTKAWTRLVERIKQSEPSAGGRRAEPHG